MAYHGLQESGGPGRSTTSSLVSGQGVYGPQPPATLRVTRTPVRCPPGAAAALLSKHKDND